MRKLIFKMAQKMYFTRLMEKIGVEMYFTPLKIVGKVVCEHLLPWAVWSPIYDRWHRL